MYDNLIAEADRKKKKLKKAHDRKLNEIAQLLKFWCSGNGRPANGAFATFDTLQSRRGDAVVPRFV